MKSPTTITITETLDPHGIGDPTGCDTEWQAAVCVEIREAIVTDLTARYPAAKIAVTVEMAHRGSGARRVVTTDGDEDVIKEHAQRAGEDSFEIVCGSY